MDQKTLTALQQSIAKWEANARVDDWRDAKVDASDCPLCIAFPDEDCAGCPVAKATGERECEGSPYYDARDIHHEWKDALCTGTEFRLAAQAEVDFLKSLLPKDDNA